MPPEIIPEDEEYDENEDSDFAPDAVPVQDEEESSDSESDADAPVVKAPTPKGKKRKRGDDKEAEDLGIENSGDEAIIKTGKKERKRSKKSKEELEDEGGEGGLIKTRSMRALEKTEKKPLANTSAATIDVDAVWAAMISGKPLPSTESNETQPTMEGLTIKSPQRSLSPDGKPTSQAVSNAKDGRPPSSLRDGPDSMIMIKRTYNFAGKVHTEQKLVPRDSAEAKLYLESQPEPSGAAEEEEAGSSSPFTKPKRPPKLARRSIFEPVVENLPQRKDLHFGIRKESDLALVGITGKEKKLNTVEKSAMDWAGFVDKEGIKDELNAAGKSKGAYKARQEFLARVEQKKEEDARRARGLPVGGIGGL